MRRLLAIVAIAGSAFATAASGQRTSSAADLSPKDIAAIRATTDRWVTAVHAGRWKDATATYTDDAVLWISGAETKGRAAILKFFEAMQPWDSTRVLYIDEIRGRGDMAFVSGHATTTAPGAAPVVVSKTLDVRLRQPDGTWLFYRDMVSPIRPPN